MTTTNAISSKAKTGESSLTIPYETDFTLIGTTDAEHEDVSEKPVCTPEEQHYLVRFRVELLEEAGHD